jgi:hypothetical protein
VVQRPSCPRWADLSHASCPHRLRNETLSRHGSGRVVAAGNSGRGEAVLGASTSVLSQKKRRAGNAPQRGSWAAVQRACWPRWADLSHASCPHRLRNETLSRHGSGRVAAAGDSGRGGGAGRDDSSVSSRVSGSDAVS